MAKCVRWEIIVVVVCLLSSVSSSKVAKNFIRSAVAFQISDAVYYASTFRVPIYVYFSSSRNVTGTFPSIAPYATVYCYDHYKGLDMRVNTNIFNGPQHFRQYTNQPLSEDTVGLYVGLRTSYINN